MYNDKLDDAKLGKVKHWEDAAEHHDNAETDGYVVDAVSS